MGFGGEAPWNRDASAPLESFAPGGGCSSSRSHLRTEPPSYDRLGPRVVPAPPPGAGPDRQRRHPPAGPQPGRRVTVPVGHPCSGLRPVRLPGRRSAGGARPGLGSPGPGMARIRRPARSFSAARRASGRNRPVAPRPPPGTRSGRRAVARAPRRSAPAPPRSPPAAPLPPPGTPETHGGGWSPYWSWSPSCSPWSCCGWSSSSWSAATASSSWATPNGSGWSASPPPGARSSTATATTSPSPLPSARCGPTRRRSPTRPARPGSWRRCSASTRPTLEATLRAELAVRVPRPPGVRRHRQPGDQALGLDGVYLIEEQTRFNPACRPGRLGARPGQHRRRGLGRASSCSTTSELRARQGQLVVERDPDGRTIASRQLPAGAGGRRAPTWC